jgi:hypothetical protein
MKRNAHKMLKDERKHRQAAMKEAAHKRNAQAIAAAKVASMRAPIKRKP